MGHGRIWRHEKGKTQQGACKALQDRASGRLATAVLIASRKSARFGCCVYHNARRFEIIRCLENLGSFMGRFKKDEVAVIAASILDSDVEPARGNWLSATSGPLKGQAIFYSQCKPSSASRGHWTYDFFHTIELGTIENVTAGSGYMFLINYVDKTYALLDKDDLLWVQKYSTRPHSKIGSVCDFVIDRSHSGRYYLRPYDRDNRERRSVGVKGW